VLPDTLDDGLGARVADREALARKAPEVSLAARRPVERDVADDYALLRIVGRPL
jgi:hypothetical protein